MMTDPIGDSLIQIKNAYMARKDDVILPYSKFREALFRLLEAEGYIGKVEIDNSNKKKKNLKTRLLYPGKSPRFTYVERVSKPGKKVYAAKDEIPRVLNGLGISVLSTSRGLMTDREARKRGLGGEIICKIW